MEATMTATADLNPGTYEARALAWNIGKAGNGTLQLGVRFGLLDRDGNPTGPKLLWYGFLTADAMKTTMRAVRAMGWKGTDIRLLGKREAQLDAHVVELDVQREEFEGKTRLRVQWVNEPGIPMGGGDLTPGELESLARQANPLIAGLP